MSSDPMDQLSISPAERARKAHARVLSALQRPGTQTGIAAALGASEATISRIKNERLEECLAFLYCAGFKLVPSDKVCIDPEALAFMRQITGRVLSNEEQAKQLFRDDE